MSSFGHLTNLDPGKLQDLETVLTAILALPITRDTLAQVIEGRPTRTPFSDEIKNAEFKFDKTIIVGDNVKPGHQAMRQFDEFKTAFALKDLILELKVRSLSILIPYSVQTDLAQLVQSYEKAPQGSREYVLHLLKIAAASVHALAGSLYASSHKDMVIKPPEPEGGHSRLFDKTDEFYVNFYHTNYQLFEKYPFGLLNVVGYWAEAEIFGGVVLFEHEEGLGVHQCHWLLMKAMLTDTRSLKLLCTHKRLPKHSSYRKNSSSVSRICADQGTQLEKSGPRLSFHSYKNPLPAPSLSSTRLGNHHPVFIKTSMTSRQCHYIQCVEAVW